jgi:negative regulator of flagellin synthesis FlgM
MHVVRACAAVQGPLEQIMKIGPLESKPLTAATSGGERKAAPAAVDAKGTAADASAKVDISSTGSLMAESGADPTFDAAKVDRIAAAIRDGSFKIDANKIADKLISNAQDLLKRYSQS